MIERFLHFFRCAWIAQDVPVLDTWSGDFRRFRTCSICGRRQEWHVVGSVGIGVKEYWMDV